MFYAGLDPRKTRVSGSPLPLYLNHGSTSDMLGSACLITLRNYGIYNFNSASIMSETICQVKCIKLADEANLE